MIKPAVVVDAVVVVEIVVVEIVVAVVVQRPDGDVSAGHFRRRWRRVLIDAAASFDAAEATPLETSVQRRLLCEIKVPAHFLLVLNGRQLALQSLVVSVVDVVKQTSAYR